MYHCSTMPMSLHIANGMFGAVVIDPPDLPPVDREYVLVQSELYLGPQGGDRRRWTSCSAEQPDAVVFNGYANQYDHRPLTARVGERVRIWVLDAGPNRGHVVPRRRRPVRHRLRRGRATCCGRSEPGGSPESSRSRPAQGGFVELTFPEAGHYPFVSHSMVDAERGAHGIIAVTG